MSKLTDIIQKASQSYYQDGTSTLSDAEFDKALEELKTEDPDSSLLTDVGHGYDINKDTTPGARLPHKNVTTGTNFLINSYISCLRYRLN